jgi:D-inositol-3-phosphate glycosyltransferase
MTPNGSYGLCYICDEYPRVVERFGGIGIAFREHAEAFARRGRGVSVICRTTARDEGVHEINGVSVHVVKPSTLPKARAVVDRLKLDALVRRVCTNVDDIVVSAEYAGPLLVRSFRNPLIVHLEGSMTVSTIEQDRDVPRLARFFERRTVELADAISAASGYCAKATLSALGMRPRPVHVFPNSVDATRFTPVAPADEIDPHRVLFVGKMNRLKGLFVLAEAMSRVFARVPEATLTLIGGDHIEHGHDQSCLQRVLASFTPADRARVRALGLLPHAEVAREVQRCGVLVLPSFTEMCPTVVLEAASCARPVVASNRGGIPELVQDGRTGLLADPDRPATFADALVRLLTSPAEADAMGRAGRQRVLTTFTSEAVVDGLQHFYDGIFADRQRGARAGSRGRDGDRSCAA